jgi:hypothetical protein
VRVVVIGASGNAGTSVLAALEREDVHVDAFEIQDELDRRVVALTVDRPSEQLVGTLSDLDYVIGVRWRR